MLKNWLQAFRLKTLPLAVSGISAGAFVANIDGFFNLAIYLLALFTAILLQILSNLANDYGDFKKGTDNENRLGPKRALQSGIISEKAMLNAVILFSVASLVSGITLLYISLKSFADTQTLIMLLLGLGAIGAAIKYTVGKGAYGYSGLGDIFVFVFFGLVAVVGTYFLMAQQITQLVFYPAFCVGLLSVGVLNINNLRDITNDKASGKITIAVRLGREKTKIYQMVLTLFAFMAMGNYVRSETEPLWLHIISLVLWVPIILSYIRILKNKEGEELLLNNELKAYSLGTALLSLGVFVLSFFV